MDTVKEVPSEDYNGDHQYGGEQPEQYDPNPFVSQKNDNDKMFESEQAVSELNTHD